MRRVRVGSTKWEIYLANIGKDKSENIDWDIEELGTLGSDKCCAEETLEKVDAERVKIT